MKLFEITENYMCYIFARKTDKRLMIDSLLVHMCETLTLYLHVEKMSSKPFVTYYVGVRLVMCQAN